MSLFKSNRKMKKLSRGGNFQMEHRKIEVFPDHYSRRNNSKIEKSLRSSSSSLVECNPRAKKLLQLGKAAFKKKQNFVKKKQTIPAPTSNASSPCPTLPEDLEDPVLLKDIFSEELNPSSSLAESETHGSQTMHCTTTPDEKLPQTSSDMKVANWLNSNLFTGVIKRSGLQPKTYETRRESNPKAKRSLFPSQAPIKTQLIKAKSEPMGLQKVKNSLPASLLQQENLSPAQIKILREQQLGTSEVRTFSSQSSKFSNFAKKFLGKLNESENKPPHLHSGDFFKTGNASKSSTLPKSHQSAKRKLFLTHDKSDASFSDPLIGNRQDQLHSSAPEDGLSAVSHMKISQKSDFETHHVDLERNGPELRACETRKRAKQRAESSNFPLLADAVKKSESTREQQVNNSLLRQDVSSAAHLKTPREQQQHLSTSEVRAISNQSSRFSNFGKNLQEKSTEQENIPLHFHFGDTIETGNMSEGSTTSHKSHHCVGHKQGLARSNSDASLSDRQVENGPVQFHHSYVSEDGLLVDSDIKISHDVSDLKSDHVDVTLLCQTASFSLVRDYVSSDENSHDHAETASYAEVADDTNHANQITRLPDTNSTEAHLSSSLVIPLFGPLSPSIPSEETSQVVVHVTPMQFLEPNVAMENENQFPLLNLPNDDLHIPLNEVLVDADELPPHPNSPAQSQPVSPSSPHVNILPEAESIAGSVGGSPKPRRRNPSAWARTISRERSQSGQSHTSLRKIVRESRNKLTKGCPETCRKKCSEKISLDQRQNINVKYWSVGNSSRQWDFISRLVQVQPVKRRTVNVDEYFRKNSYVYHFLVNRTMVQVCQPFFLNTLNISEMKVRTALKKMLSKDGVISPDKRGKGEKKKLHPALIANVADHIKSYPTYESHYCRRTSKKRYLDEKLNVAKMYRSYAISHPPGPHTANQRQYQDIFRNQFKHKLGFYKPRKDKCGKCLSFQNKTAQEKINGQLDQEKHLQNKTRAREIKDEDIKSAEVDKKVCVATFDLQKVFFSPFGNDSEFVFACKLRSYNLSIFQSVTQIAYCYVWDETTAKKGAIEISSCVYDFIQQKVKEGYTEFRLASDNCWNQNKNRFLFAMYNMASCKFNIKITHTYLEKGHTQMECDSIHSLIERRCRSLTICSPLSWYNVIRTAKVKRPYYVLKVMTQANIFDFKRVEELQKICNIPTSTIRQVTVSENELTYKQDFNSEAVTVSLLNQRPGRPINWKTYVLRKKYNQRISPSKDQLKDIKKLIEGNHIWEQHDVLWWNQLFQEIAMNSAQTAGEENQTEESPDLELLYDTSNEESDDDDEPDPK